MLNMRLGILRLQESMVMAACLLCPARAVVYLTSN